VNSQLEAMEKRLQLLERGNRNLRRGCIIILTCAAVFVSVGAKQASKRTIEANEFVLRGLDGQVQATLSTDSSGDARLVFLDHTTKTKAVLAADRLAFSDWAGNPTIALRPSSDGGTLILSGKDAGGLELSRDSKQAGLYVTTGHDWESLTVAIKKDGEFLQNGPAIELTDEKGFKAKLGQAVSAGKATTSAASLLMYGKDGKVIWSAP
jgi:hypothetical protein